jgi:hypothetical protein
VFDTEDQFIDLRNYVVEVALSERVFDRGQGSRIVGYLTGRELTVH